MYYLNFNGLTSKIDVRAALDKYLDDDIAKPVVIAKDISDIFYPLKYLPGVIITKSHDNGIVMVKGTISSMIGQIEVNGGDSGNFRFPLVSDSGETYGKGKLPLGDDMLNGGVNNVGALNTYLGYPDDHIGVIVPCNGGTNTDYTYTAYDETLGTYKYDGDQASTGDTITILANKPIGITSTHVLQDSRGKYLNNVAPGNKAIVLHTRGYLSIPFVNWTKMASDNSITDNFNATTAYDAVKKLFPFAYINDYNGDEPVNGVLLRSDAYGRFVMQDTTGTYSAAVSDQTVGRLVGVDFNYPKNFYNYADTPINSKVGGTDTLGVPKQLFVFAVLILTKILGTAPTRAQVLDAIQSAHLGYARIMLTLS